MAGAGSSRPTASDAGGQPGSHWKRAVTGRSVWDSPEPTGEEVEALKRFFPEVVVVPEGALRRETDDWGAAAVVVRSLGRRVSVESVIREFRTRAGVQGDVRGFYLDNGHAVYRFEGAGDRDRVLCRPWVVGGQALAVESWRPAFFPSEGAIRTALVWIRLPQLPVEYWSEEALRAVVQLAGELHSVDDWTVERRRLGFARVCVRLDLTRPLRPGVMLQGPDGPFWQRFTFECLDGVCLHCGRFHGSASCSVGGGEKGGGDCMAMGDGGGSGTAEAGPRLGQWLVAVRRWVPAPEGVGVGDTKVARPPASKTTRRPGKEPAREAASGPEEGPHASGGKAWSMPTKLARRRSPARREVASQGAGAETTSVQAGGRFQPLAGLVPVSADGKGDAGMAGAGPGVSGVGSGSGLVFGPGEPVAGRGSGSTNQGGLARSKRARPTESEMSHDQVRPSSKTGVGNGARKGGGRKGRAAASLLVPSRAPEGLPDSVAGAGVFLFLARGGGEPTVESPVDPGTRAEDGGRGPDSLFPGGSIDVTHEDAVCRLRHAIQGEGDTSSAMDASVPGMDLVGLSGVGSGAVPSPHQPPP